MESVGSNATSNNAEDHRSVPMDTDERTTVSRPSTTGQDTLILGRVRSFLEKYDVQRSSPGFGRMIEIIEKATKGDGQSHPTSSGINTVLCLDTSGDMGEEGFKTMKETALGFLHGIEEIATKYETKENVAVVSCGGSSRILHHLSTAYGDIRKVIETLKIGGQASLFEALLVCLCEIIERASVTTIGETPCKPRIIIVTAGKTIDIIEDGSLDEDTRKTNSEKRFVNLLSKIEEDPKGHKPLVFIAPIGGDHPGGFLQNLRDRQDGDYCILPCEKVKGLCKHQKAKEIEEEAYAQIKALIRSDVGKELEETKIEELVKVFAGDWEDLEKICRAVKKRADSFQKELTEPSSVPPIDTESSRSRSRSRPQQGKHISVRIKGNIDRLQTGSHNEMFGGGSEAKAYERSRSRSELRSEQLVEDGDTCSSDVKIDGNVKELQTGNFNQMLPVGSKGNAAALERSRSESNSYQLDEDGDSDVVVHGNIDDLQTGNFNKMFPVRSQGNADSAPSQVPQSSMSEIDTNKKNSVEIAGHVGSMQVGSHNQMIPTNIASRDERYKMDADPRGICVIINNEHFRSKERRKGTAVDRDGLAKVFKEKLKFTVRTDLNDLDAEEMKKEVQNLAKLQHDGYDCVVVIFLTHGADKVVFGSDDQTVNIDDITSPFKADVCTSLAKKPKIFFFSSCRGDIFPKGIPVRGDGGGNDLPDLVGPADDFFIGYATASGTQALRNTERGTWFMEELIKVLNEDADRDHFEDMMITVKNKVSSHKVAQDDGTSYHQTVEIRSTLQKRLYF